MTELPFLTGIESISNISLLGILRINHYLSLILLGIPNRFPKIVFALSAEHALQAGNIEPRIIMDVDMVGFMEKGYWLIIVMTQLLLSICIALSLCRLIPSVWFYQLALLFFKHLLKLYMFVSDCNGWNLMRF